MTRDQVTAVFDRVKSWPQERQEEAAEFLLALEGSGDQPFPLTDDERADLEAAVAEVDRGEVASEDEVARVFRRSPPCG
jgi:hypothetical protein